MYDKLLIEQEVEGDWDHPEEEYKNHMSYHDEQDMSYDLRADNQKRGVERTHVSWTFS